MSSSFCRSGAIAASIRAASIRAASIRSKTVISKAPSLPSSTTTALLNSRSMVSALGAVELSLLPLHSAIASSRLRSSIGVDASFWTCLSQGRALPL